MNDIPKPIDFLPNQKVSPFSGGDLEGAKNVRIKSGVDLSGANSLRLQQLLSTREHLLKARTQKIHFAPAILFQNDKPVFFPKTINVIQGKAGVHKSRLAETICASLLKRPGTNRDLLGFKTEVLKYYNVCYVDTERNLSDQLPYALQQIQLKAGFNMEDTVPNFDCVSLLEFSREERFEVLDEYLEHIRNNSNQHTFIVLDVITDCVFNFNDARDSMKLIDMMNRSINRYDITFLCLIHENPGSIDKARGHLGTELINKASTVIQVSFEDCHPERSEGTKGRTSSLIKISYLKCRATVRHEPFFAEYSDYEKGLVLADAETVTNINAQNLEFNSLLEMLWLILKDGGMSRKNLYPILKDELFIKERTLDNRINKIIKQTIPIETPEKEIFYLTKTAKGQEMIYTIIPLNSSKN
ncbi:MAG: hypothetical protein SFY32_14100 [Bacteroidota bacterium]|nr:hypothetical protein [Bacteroidota bacterium]